MYVMAASLLVNTLETTELHNLKGCILWYVNFVSIFKSLMEFFKNVPPTAGSGYTTPLWTLAARPAAA